MPANAMKLSQHIAHCQQLLSEHGDVDCILPLGRDGVIVALDGRNVSVQGEVMGQKLPAPCAVFGAWVDQEGRVKTSPGQKYEATADAGDWTYDRAQAPHDTLLRVWRRYGGEAPGYRSGDKWFVDEGGKAPVEIIPAGILGWKLP